VADAEGILCDSLEKPEIRHCDECDIEAGKASGETLDAISRLKAARGMQNFDECDTAKGSPTK
jgi:hypothetical protein